MITIKKPYNYKTKKLQIGWNSPFDYSKENLFKFWLFNCWKGSTPDFKLKFVHIIILGFWFIKNY